jgi:hypothetical protein
MYNTVFRYSDLQVELRKRVPPGVRVVVAVMTNGSMTPGYILPSSGVRNSAGVTVVWVVCILSDSSLIQWCDGSVGGGLCESSASEAHVWFDSDLKDSTGCAKQRIRSMQLD